MGEPTAKAALAEGPVIQRRYKVLCVFTHPVQYAAPLLRAMSRHPQLDVTVAYCSLQGAEAGYDPEFGINVQWDLPLLDGYSWTQLSNRSLRPGLGHFFGLMNPGLWSLVRGGRFDAVTIHTGYVYATFWIGLLAAKLSGVPVLFGTDAVSLQSRKGGWWKRGIKRMLWPRLFGLADQVLVLSTGGRELMLSLGIREERISLTPFVVNNDWWLEEAERADRYAVRTSWSVASSDLVILCCAKLQAWKQPLDLLRAFAEAAIPDAVLVFAGDGPLHGRIEAEASALGVRERIRILGFVNQTQLPGVYRAADLLVVPSSHEPFGLVVNEAMLCECPVVASDHVGAGRDLIVPGRTGFVYPCGNVTALAEILGEITKDRARLAEMGHAARERMSTWSPREHIAAYIQSVECAVSRRGGQLRRAEGAKRFPSSAGAEEL